MARIETLQLLRDRVSLSLLLMMPAAQLALFGFAAEPDPHGVPLVIAGDAEIAAGALRRVIEGTGYFDIIADRQPSGAGARAVAAGEALVALELPPVGGAGAGDGEDDPDRRIRVIVDATDPAAVRPALGALEAQAWKDIATRRGNVPTIDVEWRYNPERKSAWAIAPALIGVVTMISMLMLGALSLVREREQGTWEGLLATPVDGIDALIGKLAPPLALGILQALALALAGSVLFGLPLSGALLWLALAAALHGAAHLVTGFALSALAETQIQAVLSAVFFYLPSMVLSGFLFPFQGMPGWAKALAEILPLTHFIRVARALLLRGAGPGALVEMVPVLVFAGAATIVALATYRRRLD